MACNVTTYCPVTTPTYKRPRSRSFATDKAPSPLAKCVARSASEGTPVTMHRVRITYSDDALCENSVANMQRLVRAAQETDADPSTSAMLARKALRYRNKLALAQAADMDDPAFDVASFMGVTWCKVIRA